MYGQNILPTYELDIAPADLAAIDDEFHHKDERIAAGLDPHPYHAATFRYVVNAQPVEVPNVMVRLKGNSSWAQTIAFDPNPKAQFVISFNEEPYADRRFLGVRKLELDMPRTDMTFIRQRLALKALRTAGIPAQCANNAKLVINGQYYGLYTNLEKLDKEFLQRVFGHADDNGDLGEGGRIPKTNEAAPAWDRLDAFWMIQNIGQLDGVADLEGSMKEWAAEMMIGDSDGYGNGGANFYIYDHPTRGYMWLPVDLDTTFDPDFIAADSSPVFYPYPFRWELDWYHYLVVMNDDAGMDRFATALTSIRARYDAAALQGDLDTFSAQIKAAGEADPHRPFTLAAHATSLAASREYMTARANAVDAWLACRAHGGADRDGDGYDLCHDCNDGAADVHPDATETCNMRDDDCNGALDDLAGGAVCE